MHYVYGLILAFTLSISAHARTLADVEIPEHIEIPEHANGLMLNGAGIRTKMFFKIYVAGLYLPSPVTDADRIINSEVPKRISMNFVYSEVSKDKMDDGWQDGFADNTSPQQMDLLKARLERFKAMFGTMVKGDVVWLDFLPAVGTRVTINGEEKGVVPGQDFSSALLRVWLGREPIMDSLKKELLGK